MGTLSGRTVLITGGNGGIGLGMAQAVADAGAQIVIWGRNEEKNASALAALEDSGAKAFSLRADVGEEEDVERAFAESVEFAGGRIDSVFANAGTTGNGERFPEVSLDEWHRVMRINLDGVFLVLRSAAKHMIALGGGGALVAVSSTSAIHGAAGNEAYGTAKTGIQGLVRALAVNLARHQIRVNSLVPGWTKTDLASFAYGNDRFREATTQRTPVRRWAEPSEMGDAAVFLANPTNTFHTGDSVVVDGGYTVY